MELKGVISKSSDVFFFTSSRSFLDHGIVECKAPDKAQGSPLFTALFALPWVEEASAEGRALIVKKKSGSASWDKLAPEVASIIRSLAEKGTAFFPDSFPRKMKSINPTTPVPINETNVSTPLGKRIQKVLTETVAPGLASHGGYAAMVDLREGKVYIYFGGGCQGCSQASVTVKKGIETILLREFPELSEVIDVTDHSAGKNPFYK